MEQNKTYNKEPEAEPDNIKLGYGYEDEIYDDEKEYKGNPCAGICFTINNYNDKHIEFFKGLRYKYLIMAVEYGKKNKKKHIQGFISLETDHKKRLSTLSNKLKKYASTGCWMANCRGTPMDNMIYCKKDGNILFEDGDIKLCGKGSQARKLRDLQQLLDNGTSIKEIAKENFELYIQYGKRIEAYQELMGITENERNEYTKAIYLYGSSGIQKTTNFISKMKELNKWNKVEFLEYDGKYYSNYKNKEIVVFDDDNNLEEKDILNLINIKPWKMRQLGKYKDFNSKYVIIIDNRSIDERFGTTLMVNGSQNLYKSADFRIKRRFIEINYDTDDGKKEFDRILKEDL